MDGGAIGERGADDGGVVDAGFVAAFDAACEDGVVGGEGEAWTLRRHGLTDCRPQFKRHRQGAEDEYELASIHDSILTNTAREDNEKAKARSVGGAVARDS